MTSPHNHEPTEAFFRDNNHFGLNRRNIVMFPQELLPSLELQSGRLLLSSKSTVAMNPDGHGGSIKALRASGAIDHMLARGVEHMSYFQADNPLVKIIDPVFVGLHIAAPDSSAEMSSKMVPKISVDERVGVFCRVGAKTRVIEYSDLPQDLARARGDDGRLRFEAGSIAIHLMSVEFVRRLSSQHPPLPYHRADKKVPYIDPESGRRVEPAEPNAVKLELFVFDAIPLADSSIVYETSRTEEFAPIKNATGADSPATSHQLQSDRGGAWLEAQGVRIPRNADGHVAARIELSPLTALEPGDLARATLPREIEREASIVL